MKTDRGVLQRRVYRLASLLLGDPAAAVEVIDAVLTAQPDLGRLDGAHLDRLCVLRCREMDSGQLVSDAVPEPAARAVADLRHQEREAWVLTQVFGLPIRETARAMDCSTKAAARHLANAEAALRRALGERCDAAGPLFLDYCQTLDVPEVYRLRQRRRRQTRRMAAFVAIMAAVLGFFVLVSWIARRAGGG